MPLLPASFVMFSEWLIRLLFTWSWAASWLILLVWIFLKFDRYNTPVRRHKVWLLALIGVAFFPLLSYAFETLPLASKSPMIVDVPFTFLKSVAMGNAGTPIHPLAGLDVAVVTKTKQPFTMGYLITIVWVIGFLMVIMSVAKEYWRMSRISRLAVPTTLLNLSCDQPGFRFPHYVRLGLSGAVATPLVFGLFRPKILLPSDITNWTSPEERIPILRHELTHIRRGDGFVTLFQAVLQAVFFFHPLVRFAIKQLTHESEMVADAEVIKSGVEPRPYANIILKVAEKGVHARWHYQPASFSSKLSLQRRLKMIIDSPEKRNKHPRRGGFYYIVAIVIMIATIVALAQRHTSVQAGKLTSDAHTTVLVEKLEIQGKGEIIASRETHALRSDGAESTVEESFSDKSPQTVVSKRRTIIFPDRIKVVISDATRSKSTTRLPIEDYNEYYVTGKRNPEEKCLKTFSGQPIDMNGATYAGAEEIGNVTVFKIILSPQSMGIQQWLAPKLGCDLLRQAVQISENPKQISNKSLEKLVMGEPDTALFLVPSDYEEVPPSELSGKVREKQFGNRTGMLGSATVEAEKIADQKYYASRP